MGIDEVAHRLGVSVLVVPMSAAVVALCDPLARTVAVADRLEPSVQRTVVAHELGWLHHVGTTHIQRPVVDLTDPHERAARMFADDLLMPALDVQHYWAAGEGPVALSSRFGVSRNVMMRRLRDLSLA